MKDPAESFPTAERAFPDLPPLGVTGRTLAEALGRISRMEARILRNRERLDDGAAKLADAMRQGARDPDMTAPTRVAASAVAMVDEIQRDPAKLTPAVVTMLLALDKMINPTEDGR